MSVTRLEWSGCRTGGGVTLYRFEEGGHQMPGRRQILPAVLGLGYEQISAADEVLAFFAR